MQGRQLIGSKSLSLCRARNKSVYEHVTSTTAQIIQLINTHLREQESLNVRLSSISTMVLAFYKVNFDVAFLSSQGRCSIGVIIRDSEGYVIGACMVRAPYLMDSFMAKAVAGVAAFRFAADLSLQRILVEGDALSIIHKLDSTELDVSVVAL
ncbi:hypothetical protein PVK06_033630 [Gossypium arboreum]|uniref:RNase H type-1 domain-containing protein n=1 Tax=Gossypium arboreum TaxID=29729 RepID=A0ABR0NBY1_GOSAR|nr:hypothetical protein PVK06_033630 [Gossypium arboreum]